MSELQDIILLHIQNKATQTSTTFINTLIDIETNL